MIAVEEQTKRTCQKKKQFRAGMEFITSHRYN